MTKSWMFAFVFLVLFLVGALSICAQTTEFVYQGQLQNAGVPANGNYDFEFLLYDALSGGTQVGVTLTRNSVAVANGIFSVKLDFGSNFPGASRFLEIHVRQTGGGGFTPLTPRHAVSSTPYSVKSLAADTATTATNATQLNGQAASFYQNAANLNSGALDPARLPVPLTVSGTNSNQIIRGENFSNADGSAGIIGSSSATSGATVGLQGDDFSTSGIGVFGVNHATTGVTQGVRGENNSTSGSGVKGIANATTGTAAGVSGVSGSPDGVGVIGFATATTGVNNGVRGENNSTSGSGVKGIANATTGTAAGVSGVSGSPDGVGVIGFATAITGVNNGVRGENNSTSGSGVKGIANSTTGTAAGVSGVSGSPNGVGVIGFATATTGVNTGVTGDNSSISGTGVYGVNHATTGFTLGVRGDSASPNGKGVYGFATSTTGVTQGVWGENASTSGTGVYGVGRSTTGLTTGVYGDNFSPDGTGVYGVNHATTGAGFGVRGETYGTTGIGVFGNALDTTSTSPAIGVEGDSRNALGGIGVYGHAGQYGVFGVETLGTPSDYGVYATGNLGASGFKTFRIDHPDDPTNKYLLHYATESPEVINFYRGTVVLDSAGEAVVQLPPYFAKINKDPSYTLTAVGAPMPMLHVSKEIDEAALRAGANAGPDVAAPLCSFRIAGGAPGAKVSWRIEAARNDLWVRTHAAPVEVEKAGVEKGTYQHPDLYGQPADKGIIYKMHPDYPEPRQPPPVPNPSTQPKEL